MDVSPRLSITIRLSPYQQRYIDWLLRKRRKTNYQTTLREKRLNHESDLLPPSNTECINIYLHASIRLNGVVLNYAHGYFYLCIHEGIKN
jgi:hypothetical protein